MCIWWRFSVLQSPGHKWSMWSTFRSNLVMRSQSQQRSPAAGRWGRRHQQGDWGRAAAQWTPGQSCGRPEELWWLAGREVWSSWPAEPPSPSPANTTSTQLSTEHSPNCSKRKTDWASKAAGSDNGLYKCSQFAIYSYQDAWSRSRLRGHLTFKGWN